MIRAIHTLFDAGALAEYVDGRFEIGGVTDCRFWRSFINDVYRLGADGRHWWLRIHPAGWRGWAETQAEIDAVLAVAAAGGSVARPVALRHGGYQLALEAPEGRRVAVLFTDAPGADLSYLGADGAKNARRYGEAAARLHEACDAITSPPARTLMDLAFVVTRPAATLARHLDSSDRSELTRITERITQTLQGWDALTVAFCHGDLNDSNIHFDGERATAIDFDCCGWGWRAFELAGFARGVAWRGGPDASVDRLIAGYFEGYRRHREIPATDLEAQAAMLLAQRMWVTALHLNGAGRWGAINFDRPYASRFMDWLRAWQPTLENPPAWARP